MVKVISICSYTSAGFQMDIMSRMITRMHSERNEGPLTACILDARRKSRVSIKVDWREEDGMSDETISRRGFKIIGLRSIRGFFAYARILGQSDI